MIRKDFAHDATKYLEFKTVRNVLIIFFMKYKKNLKYLLIIGLEFLTKLFAAAFDGTRGAFLQGAAIITLKGEVLPPQPVLCCHGCRQRYSKI